MLSIFFSYCYRVAITIDVSPFFLTVNHRSGCARGPSVPNKFQFTLRKYQLDARACVRLCLFRLTTEATQTRVYTRQQRRRRPDGGSGNGGGSGGGGDGGGPPYFLFPFFCRQYNKILENLARYSAPRCPPRRFLSRAFDLSSFFFSLLLSSLLLRSTSSFAAAPLLSRRREAGSIGSNARAIRQERTYIFCDR